MFHIIQQNGDYVSKTLLTDSFLALTQCVSCEVQTELLKF
jgi:hypothetical protein